MRIFFKYKYFFIVSLLLLIAHCALNIENCLSQWVLQPLPVSGNVRDIKFFDKNYGLISLDNPILIRTTNGGNNWVISNNLNIFELEKIDSLTIYGHGRQNNGNDIIYRSFNRGVNWDSVGSFPESYLGMSFINKDTGYLSGFDGNFNRIFKTINGGLTLQTLPVLFGWGKIFFLKYKINGEYYGWCSDDIYMYKTTNSGDNWFQVGNTGYSLVQLEFINENTGYATWGGNGIVKTTNGGLNWSIQYMPSNNGIVYNNINRFYFIFSDTLYGDYGVRDFGVHVKGIIWKTTNGGLAWGFQQPDTSYPYGRYNGINFPDSIDGWSQNIHTTNGGGPIIITGINPLKTEIPKTFVLLQNYPNPFNPQTTIEFSIIKSSYVSLMIYDITGKEIIKIYDNNFLNIGNYRTVLDFSRIELSSGIYFYTLKISDDNEKKLFFETKKMIYTK
jgi:hypothetical protein